MNFLKAIFAILILSPNLWATEVVHDSSTDLKMGRGYNSSTEKFGQFCLKPIWELDGSSTATVKVLSSITFDSLSRELGVGAMGRYKTGVTTTKAQAEFLQSSKSEGFSVSYIYKSNYEFPPRGMTEYTWSDHAKAQLKPIPREDGLQPDSGDDANNWTGKVEPLNPEDWYKKCGDEVITTQTLGAKFFFSIKVIFSNKRDFEKFSVNFDLSSPTVDIDLDFKKQMEKMSSRTDVVVQALQIGGQVDKLTGIFKGNPKHFVRCSAGKLEDCYEVLSSAVEYATDIRPLSEGGTGFPAQIDPNIETGKYGGPAVLSSVTQPYALITNYQEPSEQLQKLSKQTREELNDLFEEIFSSWVFSTQIRKSGLPRLNFDQSFFRLFFFSTKEFRPTFFR
ncbi:MAG: hypothetical protein HRT44_02490 [Bdellovibrionales bacterium]|nr:hypothetical protein [Bdellovibrionales bacterium]NQZ18116.1 hypothetical protein [Bdellovibrionales bacterium]